jgi:hypothetical protein
MLTVVNLVLQGCAWATADVGSSAAADASMVSGCSRPLLHLTIDSAEQLPAAEAVIAALYAVPDALESLRQQQLVWALIIADKLGAEDVAKQSVKMLIDAAEQIGGLSEAAMEELASLPVWPTCLHPLLPPIVQSVPCLGDTTVEVKDLAAIVAADTGSRVQRMLLAMFGDLEAVWRDQQLQSQLMHLPLPAMQLLLS